MDGFDYIKSLCAIHNIPALNRQIQAIDDMQAQNQVIDMVVFGQFKAGKSSFLNHLVGKDILPVGVIPVTAIITRIQYGPREKALIIQTDGTFFETALDQVGEYITEKNNPNNQKRIERIEIELPSLESFREFRFVDTPGLGSVFKHNTATTQDWFCHSGVALILIASNAPLSENDMDIIRSVITFTPEIRIIMTKADLYNDEQLEEIRQFLSESLAHTFSQNFNLHFYSIYRSVYREQIMEQMIQPIQSKRDRTFHAFWSIKSIRWRRAPSDTLKWRISHP